jgi:hypothetical protein
MAGLVDALDGLDGVDVATNVATDFALLSDAIAAHRLKACPATREP